jgi:hypothetical protein
MKTRLVARIERLEFASERISRVLLQYGWLRRLPKEYQGERRVDIVKQRIISEGLEWIEWEEVPVKGVDRP